MICYRNSEGYYDPTAGAAFAHITREEQKAKRLLQYWPLVYICSRYAGDVEHNVLAAQSYCRYAVSRNYIPLAPHLLYPQFMDDADAEQRKLGMFFGKILMDRCDEVWVFSDGTYSAGMKAEHDRAARKGRRIRYFTEDCREVSGRQKGDKST